MKGGAGSPRASTGPLCLLVLGCAGLGGPLAAQDLEGDTLASDEHAEDARLPPESEGPLGNDVFLPSSGEAATLLTRGDRGLARSRELRAAGAPPSDVGRALTAALDDWFAALDASEGGGAVAADPTGAEPLTEGSSYAIRRRLEALDGAERDAWLARFGPAARPSLDGALSAELADLERLGAVERSYPGTPAAARAALACADLLLEAGHGKRAATWLERAHHQGRLAGDPAVSAAVEARASLLPPPPAAALAPWERATELVPRGSLELRDPEEPAPGRNGVLPQRGVRPGLAWLGDGRLLVQTAGLVHELALGESGPLLVRSFAPGDLVARELDPWEPPYAGREAPGWTQSPAVRGERVVLVGGRAFVPPGTDGEVEPNVLMAIDLEGDTPRLAWAVSGADRIRGDGPRERDPRLELGGGLELCPAPRIVDGLVLVPGREIGAEGRAWLFAFDLATGELVWRRFLAQGEDIARAGGRFGRGPGARLADPGPVEVAGRLFAATHLGAAALLDLADGRAVWTLGTRRRGGADRGWSAAGPFPLGSQILWDPADSDVLYRLEPTPLAGEPPRRASLFAAPPRRRGTAELCLGGDTDETIVLGRTGGWEAVTLWRGAKSDPTDALHLAPPERFRGRGLVGRERVLACSERGVYLFDRTRELYLQDYVPLEPDGPAAGGDLYARGELVCVLGAGRLWLFRARP